MDDKLRIEIAKHWQAAKLKSIQQINSCFYPNCNKNSINSHILQKNGILSELEEDGHVFQMEIDPFATDRHIFKKTGIKKAFSFKCFCAQHDTNLFAPIEQKVIDFSLYKNLLLFTLRAKYNEKFRKMVNINLREILINEKCNLFDIRDLYFRNQQEKIGLIDIEKTEKLILNDLRNDAESFVFEVKDIELIPLCLASFYNFETTQELANYRRIYGKDKENVTDIFITVFPYKGKSKFIMAYKKKDSKIAKPYVNSIIKEKGNKQLSKLTNLLLFQCETWITSCSFYNSNIKKYEKFFSYAADFSNRNLNERKFFKINLFSNAFPNDIIQWKKNVG